MMHRLKRLLVAAMIGLALGSVALSVVVVEGAVRIWQRPRPLASDAVGVTQPIGANWEAVQVKARDGVVLDAWLFTPRQPNGSAVILLHGVGDTRLGTLSQAQFLLRAGFMALTPDCRGHGASGGDLISYGIREAGDVHAWADWVFRTRGIQRLYGLGTSLGAAILLESLPLEPRFRAVVADSPFATFEEVAYDRLAQGSRIGWRPALWPVVNIGFLYARVRYGMDLGQASPANAVRSTHVPILLIHGTSDTHIPVRHSEELHALNPGATVLWKIQAAEHMEAVSTKPEEYARRVTEWFRK